MMIGEDYNRPIVLMSDRYFWDEEAVMNDSHAGTWPG